MTFHENQTAEPVCPVFGECGGCEYRNISYTEELHLKEKQLHDLFRSVNLPSDQIEPLVASPRYFHYRNRLDLRLLRTKSREIFIGFSSSKSRHLIPIENCAIAEPAINAFIPQLKIEATARLEEKYRNANLVVGTGEDGRVRWGGIGRKSLNLDEENFLFTTINGKKIYYSLGTFFQANRFILPLVINRLISFGILDKDTIFLDLYGGVGLFSMLLSEEVKEAIVIEETPESIRLAKYNVEKNSIANISVIAGKVEAHLETILTEKNGSLIGMVDPPRGGLSLDSSALLTKFRGFKHLIYLSCNPQTLVRDLKLFVDAGWNITKTIPFDFFPRTKHLETLVLLTFPTPGVRKV